MTLEPALIELLRGVEPEKIACDDGVGFPQLMLALYRSPQVREMIEAVRWARAVHRDVLRDQEKLESIRTLGAIVRKTPRPADANDARALETKRKACVDLLRETASSSSSRKRDAASSNDSRRAQPSKKNAKKPGPYFGDDPDDPWRGWRTEDGLIAYTPAGCDGPTAPPAVQKAYCDYLEALGQAYIDEQQGRENVTVEVESDYSFDSACSGAASHADPRGGMEVENESHGRPSSGRAARCDGCQPVNDPCRPQRGRATRALQATSTTSAANRERRTTNTSTARHINRSRSGDPLWRLEFTPLARSHQGADVTAEALFTPRSEPARESGRSPP